MSHAERITKTGETYDKDNVHKAFRYSSLLTAIDVLQNESIKISWDKPAKAKEIGHMSKMIEDHFDINNLEGSETRFKAALEKETRWDKNQKEMVEKAFEEAVSTAKYLITIAKEQKKQIQ